MRVTMIIDEAFELSDVKAFALSAVLRAFAMLACAELFRTGNESRRPLSLAEQAVSITTGQLLFCPTSDLL